MLDKKSNLYLLRQFLVVCSLITTSAMFIVILRNDRPDHSRDPSYSIGEYNADNEEKAPHAHDQYNPHLMMGPRSGQWPTVRKHFIESPGNDCCAVCGSKENLEVHHVQPFHEHPEKELDPKNLITLCRDHHFRVGHLGNWKNSNPNVRSDSRIQHDKLFDKMNPEKK